LNAFLKKISLLFLIVAIAAGAVGLIPRFKEEMAKKDVALLVEYSDIDVMARQAGLSFDEMLKRLLKDGITAVSLRDLTGTDLRDGDTPLLWGTLRDLLPEGDFDGLSGNAALLVPKEYDDWFFKKYLEARFPGCVTRAVPEGSIYVLPREPRSSWRLGSSPTPWPSSILPA